MTDRQASLTLRSLKSPRAAAIAGILFALLYGVSLVLIRISIPAEISADIAWLETNLRLVALALALITGWSSVLLRTGLVGAVTVFAVLVPSVMAFGNLPGVIPIEELFVAFGAMEIYALFGSSKQVVMGPEATSAILTAAAVAPLAGGDPVRYAALAAIVDSIGHEFKWSET